MADPNKRQATRGGAFLASTHRAEAIFPPSCVISHLSSRLHVAPSALPVEKMAGGSDDQISGARPL